MVSEAESMGERRETEAFSVQSLGHEVPRSRLWGEMPWKRKNGWRRVCLSEMPLAVSAALTWHCFQVRDWRSTFENGWFSYCGTNTSPREKGVFLDIRFIMLEFQI